MERGLSPRIETDHTRLSIPRPRSENSIVEHNHPQSQTKFSKPHLPLLLVHPPTREEQADQDEDNDDGDDDFGTTIAIDPNEVSNKDQQGRERLPPFSTFVNPLRYQFPPVRASPPAQGRGQGQASLSFVNNAKEARPVSPPYIARRLTRPEVYSGNPSGNSTTSSKSAVLPGSVTASPSKGSTRSLFTRTELRIGSSPPSILHSGSPNPNQPLPLPNLRNRQPAVDGYQRTLRSPEERSYGSVPLSGTGSVRSTGVSSPFSTATLERSLEADRVFSPSRSRQPLPGLREGRRSSQQLFSTHQATSSVASASASASSSTRPLSQLHSTTNSTLTTARPLYYPHAKASPFVYQRPRLSQRNSVSEIRMTESISPDRQLSSSQQTHQQQQQQQEQQQQQQQYRRSGSPMSGQREETPTPTLIKREVPPVEGDASRETGEGKPTGSDPQHQAEAEEARDGLGKTPEFDFTARRHSLATSAFISPNGGQAGGVLEPIRVGGGYGQNAPTHPSPLGLGASPVMPNSSASTGSSGNRVAQSVNVNQPGGPQGPGAASFRKRKESHDRAAGYMEPHDGIMPGTMPSPAMSASGPHHHVPPHHSSSISSNPASSTSHNNVFQVPPPPVFSNPFGQHPSGSSTSIDRLEPPAKRRGSTYDARMSHLSIAPTGSPPIGTGDGGPQQPGMPGGQIPANSWWNQQPDRRDSTASMYSNRSLASSGGGYGSSTTSYSLMSDKGGYAPPPYSGSTKNLVENASHEADLDFGSSRSSGHMGGYMNAPGPESMHDPRASSSMTPGGPVMSVSGHYMEPGVPMMGDPMGHYSSSRSTPVQERQGSVSGLAHNPAFNALPPDTKEAIGGASFSRSPELRVSHKLAERKRRKEMRDLFDELRDQLPQDRGMKSSKWEILSKAVDHIQTIKRHNSDMAREIDGLRREVEGLRVGAAAAAAASGVAYGVPPTYQQPPFNGYLSMNSYPPAPPGAMPPHGHPPGQQAPPQGGPPPLGGQSVHSRNASS